MPQERVLYEMEHGRIVVDDEDPQTGGGILVGQDPRLLGLVRRLLRRRRRSSTKREYRPSSLSIRIDPPCSARIP